MERLEDRTLFSVGFGMAIGIGGSDVGGDFGNAVAVDGGGNVYVQGHFYGTIDADPGPGTHLLTSAGDSDDFVAKYDPVGGLLWAVRMGGDSDLGGGGVALDGSGNVFVTGSIQGTADFGSFTLTSQGLSDAFVAKLDAATGTFQWATRMGGSVDTNSGQVGFGIAADGLGNVYTTGRMVNPADPVGGVPAQIFVAKHDGNGNLDWLKNIGQPRAWGGQGNDLALDGAGNVYVTGQFTGNVDFNPGPGTFNLSSTKVKGLVGNSDVFALSLNSAGNFRWAFSVTGDKGDVGKAIAVDGAGSIYLAGDFASTSNDFDPGGSKTSLTNAGGYSDIFVAKYSSSRSLIWARSIGGPGGVSGDVCNAIAVDGSGNVFTTGFFEGTVDFNPGSGTNSLTSAGSQDVFVSQLSSGGNYVWAGRMGGTSVDRANALALDVSGNVYTTGLFAGTADFDPGAGTYNLTSTLDDSGNPSLDAFVSKLAPLSALQAAGATAPAKAGNAILSDEQVTPLLAEAIARWQAAGVDISGLDNLQVRIADLGGDVLGLAFGHTIWLDDNAADRGWFVDATPWDDSEFSTPGNQGEQISTDLLTVLAHEIGHLLGQDHAADGVMAATLATGTRGMPARIPFNDWSAIVESLAFETMSKRRG